MASWLLFGDVGLVVFVRVCVRNVVISLYVRSKVWMATLFPRGSWSEKTLDFLGFLVLVASCGLILSCGLAFFRWHCFLAWLHGFRSA